MWTAARTGGIIGVGQAAELSASPPRRAAPSVMVSLLEAAETIRVEPPYPSDGSAPVGG